MAIDPTNKPKWAQYFYASHFMLIVSVFFWILYLSVISVYLLNSGIFSERGTEIVDLANSVLIIILYLIIGVLSWILFLIIISPVLVFRGELNGGPFRKGDMVIILVGQHKNKIVRVYEKSQGNTVRVDLGEEIKLKFKDIYSPFQLLKIDQERTVHKE